MTWADMMAAVASRIRPLTPDRARRTLVARLAPTADKIRQLATKLGARPLRVFLVWTVAGGSERGGGEEETLAEIEILPTPFVADLSSLTLNPFAAGKYPVGSVRVSEVSMARFTLDVLRGDRLALPVGATRGRGPIRTAPLETFRSNVSGELLEAERVSFFYEIVEDGRGDNPPARRRFRLFSEPHPNAESVEWILFLERTHEDRSRTRLSQEGVDPDQAESDS